MSAVAYAPRDDEPELPVKPLPPKLLIVPSRVDDGALRAGTRVRGPRRPLPASAPEVSPWGASGPAPSEVMPGLADLRHLPAVAAKVERVSRTSGVVVVIAPTGAGRWSLIHPIVEAFT